MSSLPCAKSLAQIAAVKTFDTLATSKSEFSSTRAPDAATAVNGPREPPAMAQSKHPPASCPSMSATASIIRPRILEGHMRQPPETAVAATREARNPLLSMPCNGPRQIRTASQDMRLRRQVSRSRRPCGACPRDTLRRTTRTLSGAPCSLPCLP